MCEDTGDERDGTSIAGGQGRGDSVSRRTVDETDSVAESIVVAVSALTGTDLAELEPLHHVLDVDALENLFAPKVDGTPRSPGTVSFAYCGCRVVVEGTDRITVQAGTEQIDRRS